MVNMLKQNTIAIYRTGENFIKKYFSLIFCVLIITIAGIMTFKLQDTIVGFEKGYDELAPKHHGSVSSKGLAIISTATLENRFVGYAVRYKDDQNNVIYDYFDRYPVFFSALFNRILTLQPKLSGQIYLAKQVMNLIFIATLIVAFLLGTKLIKNKLLSLVAVLIVFSNPYLLFYKDMVHFDQPALFGFLLLTYAIALYKIDHLKFPMYIATFAAIGLGRGYASYAILILWLAIEGFLVLRTRDLRFGQKVMNVLKHPSFHLLLIGIVWGAGLLSYNIIVEAQKKNIPILETSILDSAGRRLSLDEEFDQANEQIINWKDYAQTEVSRIIKWAFPIYEIKLGFIGNTVILLIMFLLMGLVIRKQTLEKRIIFIILAFSGFVWMIPLRNMAAFHDYTTMYFIGIQLTFFFSVLVLLKPSRDAVFYLALMGLVVYVSAITQVKNLHDTNAGNANEYTYDFMRIEDKLGSPGHNIYVKDSVPYGTNAVEFYLQDQYIAPLTLADYVISADRNYSSDNLTPDNSVMFLFKNLGP